MILELDTLRARFGRFLVYLFWAHVPLLAAVAWLCGQSVMNASLAGTVLASSYHLTWWRNGIAPVTRYLSAVALMAEPAILLLLLQGHPWQMDMHMYFFALLALTIAWCDRRAIIAMAIAIALHHLLLLYLLPLAVFPGEGNLGRVLFHAAIVAFQTGALVWLSDMLVSRFDDINRMRQEILAKNATLQDRTREAEEATKAKSMFLANMSHEIRTPMNAILGFSHLINRTEMSEKQRDYVTKINGSAVYLLRLINDILDFSKNEAGKLMLETAPFDLRSTVANQIRLVTPEADVKQIRIISQIDADLPRLLVGDELRIGQVVLNLLSNAVKFSRDGEVTVGINLSEINEQRAAIELFVRDRGIGIPVDQQAQLFSSFTQADSSTTRQFGGTGLGLAICRQIVESMGGDIGVKSSHGEGSTFTVRLDIALDDADRHETCVPSPWVRELRVLAADDNAAARQIIEEIFVGWGMSVDMVASGNEVIAACGSAAERGAPYDLVLLDWKMPGMDGLDTVRGLQEVGRGGRVPVALIVTAYATDDLAEKVNDANVAAFLSKPIDPRDLLDTIEALFSANSAADKAGPTQNAPPMVLEALRGSRILLCEDNDINREIAVELLSDAGLLVDYAENGRVGCELVAKMDPPYCAILMDLQMPEMDGFEATAILRQTWTSENLPIIAMTAHAFEEERQRCFAAGMNDHVAKPVDPAQLVDTLNRWLRPAAQPPASVAMPAAYVDGAVLPATLPPFDIAAALGRVNGKAELLRKLIISFAETYATVTALLETQITAGKLAEARRLAHSLKGVAGSLELPDVQAIAADIEILLAKGAECEARALFAKLDAALKPAVLAARSLETGPVSQVVTPTGPADPAAEAAAWKKLRDLVERRSLSARAAFDELGRTIGLSDAARRDHLIQQALERFDYEAVLALIPDNHPEFEDDPQ